MKYARAPSNLDDSLLDSLTGDVTHLRWKDLPATVATSIASLLSGAVLGPEGAIGNIASKVAALFCDLFRVPADRRPRLVFASVSSGYNGLLENPVFAAVLGTEIAETRRQGLATLPASLIGGVVGYGVFLLVQNAGFVNFLHLPPVQSYDVWDAIIMVPLALAGLVLAVVTAAFMKLSAAVFGRLKERVVLRALAGGIAFSVVGVLAPVMLFSGETQVQTVIGGASGYGVALLLVMAVGKLALLGVAFKSGFLGGPTFPLIFASTSVALALNLVVPGVPVAVFLAGIMAGAVYALFRTPLMVVLLTGFMLDAGPTMVALIVLAVATVMIGGAAGAAAHRRPRQAAAQASVRLIVPPGEPGDVRGARPAGVSEAWWPAPPPPPPAGRPRAPRTSDGTGRRGAPTSSRAGPR